MTVTRRLKIAIISAFVFAAILCAACFTVSYAKWGGGGSASAEASGSVGRFYVDYPYTPNTSNALDSSQHYLLIENGTGVNTYYHMAYTSTVDERRVGRVYLEGGKPVKFTHGAEALKNIGHENTGYHGKVDAAAGTFTPAHDGFFDITLKNCYAESSATRKLYIDANYITTVNIKFGDRTVVLKPEGSVNLHIYKYVNGTNDINLTGAWPGKACNADHSDTTTTEANTTDIDLSAEYKSTDDIRVIFNYNKSSNYWQTSNMKIGETFSEDDPYYISFNEGTAHGSSYPLTMTKNTAPPEPSSSPINAADDGADEKTVRQVSAKTDNGVKYTNYVCVSRIGGTESTMAYVNFEVDGPNLDAVIKTFKVERTPTSANGVPQTGAKTEEHVYNSPVGKKLGEINAIDGKNDPDVVESDHLNSNYVLGGSYIMLYFGAGEKQYYALDVTIETETEANFTLIAKCSNIDKRNRFETGYGYPHGYYLGGEFNGLNMWDPRKAARVTVNAGHGAEDAKELTYKDNNVDVTYSGPSYIDVQIELELTAQNDTIKLYRLNGSDGKREDGASPTLYFIPHHIYKNYTGGAGSDGTALFNKDMNVIIRNPGTYVLHFVGNVKYKDDVTYAYDRKERNYLTKTEYNNLSAAERTEEIYGEKRYVLIDNWNGIVDSLYVTKKGEAESATVTFDANGGELTGDATQTVGFGQKLQKPAEPTPPESFMTFVGWFTDAECTTAYDFDKTVGSTEDFTLYAKWDMGNYRAIKYDYNYGGAPAGDTVYVEIGNKLTRVVDPVNRGEDWGGVWHEFAFVGWYADSACTNYWNFATDVVSDNTTLYAKWQDISGLAGYKMSVNGALRDMTKNEEFNPVDGFTEEYYARGDFAVGDEVRFYVDGKRISNVKNDETPTLVGTAENSGALPVFTVLQAGAYGLYYKTNAMTGDEARAGLTTVPIATAVTVTFDLDGGAMQGGASDSQTIESGNNATKPADPTKGGCVFLGWYADAQKTTPFDFGTAIASDTTVYAKWTNNISTDGWYVRINDDADLIYLDNYLDNTVIRDSVIAAVGDDHGGVVGGARIELNAGDRIYLYTFGVTNEKLSATAQSGAGVVDTATAADYVTVSATGEYNVMITNASAKTVYIAKTVTFDLDGGKIGDRTEYSQIVGIGKTVARPTDPAKSYENNHYHVFLGWYADAERTQPFDFDTEIETMTTVYAKWSNVTDGWSVRINDNMDLTSLGNVNGDSDVQAIVGTHSVVGAADFTLAAGDRIYLYQLSNDQAPTTFTRLTAADGAVNAATNAECVTVKTAGSYKLLFVGEGAAGATLTVAATVTFDANGGELASISSTTKIVEVGQKTTRPTDPIVTGHAVAGWYKSADFVDDDLWDFDTDVVTSDITLHAKFEGAAYALTIGGVTTYYAAVKSNTERSYYIEKEISNSATFTFYENLQKIIIPSSAIDNSASQLLSVSSGSVKFSTTGKYKFDIKYSGTTWIVNYHNTGFRLIGVLNGTANWNSPGVYEFVEITPIKILKNNDYIPPKMYALTYTIKSGDEFRVFSTASGSAGWLEVRGDSQAYSGWGSGNLKPSTGWKCVIYVLVHADNSADVALTDA